MAILQGTYHKIPQTSRKKFCNRKYRWNVKRNIYIPPEKRQQIIDEIRLIQYIKSVEYQSITNLLDNENTQPSSFRAKNWVEINEYIQ